MSNCTNNMIVWYKTIFSSCHENYFLYNIIVTYFIISCDTHFFPVIRIEQFSVFSLFSVIPKCISSMLSFYTTFMTCIY